MKIGNYIKDFFSWRAFSIFTTVLTTNIVLVTLIEQCSIHREVRALEDEINSRTLALTSLANDTSLLQLDSLQIAGLMDIIDFDKEIIKMTNNWAYLESRLALIDKRDYSSDMFVSVITSTMNSILLSTAAENSAIKKAQLLISTEGIREYLITNEFRSITVEVIMNAQSLSEEQERLHEGIHNLSSIDKSLDEAGKELKDISRYLKEFYSSMSYKEYKLSIIKFLIYVRKACTEYLNESKNNAVAPDTN